MVLLIWQFGAGGRYDTLMHPNTSASHRLAQRNNEDMLWLAKELKHLEKIAVHDISLQGRVTNAVMGNFIALGLKFGQVSAQVLWPKFKLLKFHQKWRE